MCYDIESAENDIGYVLQDLKNHYERKNETIRHSYEFLVEEINESRKLMEAAGITVSPSLRFARMDVNTHNCLEIRRVFT